MNADPYHTIVAHVIATLPEGITQRKAVLTALTQILPSGFAYAKPILDLVSSLHEHSIDQRELNLALYADQANSTKPNESNPSGPGDGSGDGGHHPNDPEHKTK